jgi:hypothetical protein
MRKIILHYHLSKNAGTSLDTAFKANFGQDKWATNEFPTNKNLNAKQLTNGLKAILKSIVFHPIRHSTCFATQRQPCTARYFCTSSN